MRGSTRGAQFRRLAAGHCPQTRRLDDRRAIARRPLLIDTAVVEGMEEVYGLFDAPSGPWVERIQQVHRCIGQLSGKLRAAVDAVYGRGLSIAVASQELGVGFAAVAQRLSRGRTLIRTCVELASQTQPEEKPEHV